MKRAVGFVAAGLLTLAACSPDQAPTAPSKVSGIDPTLDMTVPDQGNAGEPTAHVEFIRGLTRAAATGQASASSNLVYHGGPVLHGTEARAIFWGSSWNSSTFTGDKRSGLDAFYGGIGGSSYLNTTSEYTDGAGNVGIGVSYLGSVIDPVVNNTHKAPSTSAVLNEVCKVVGSSAVSNGYYAVYSDIPRGHAGYCAWHSASSCGGTPVQFAFFFVLDGDPGCDPGSSQPYSQGLAALANVSGHELSEAVTDPRLNAWYDNSGAENADKCAWTFSGTVNFGGKNWKIQGNWSNAANNAGTGYTLGGCIQTK